MEFIGFKGTKEMLRTDYTMWQNFERDTVLARLGNALQDRGIAYDQSFAYSGTYSLQEIAAYKSKQRFVTFVEAEKNNFAYSYSNVSKQVTGYDGGISFGAIALPFLIVGGATSSYADGDKDMVDMGRGFVGAGVVLSLISVPLIIYALTPAKTTITFHGIYSIYVYDTENEEIIYKDTVNVGPLMDKYKGSYENPDTNKNAVWDYYSTLAFNEITRKYSEIHRFLETKR
jgi:hypothetical protein